MGTRCANENLASVHSNSRAIAPCGAKRQMKRAYAMNTDVVAASVSRRNSRLGAQRRTHVEWRVETPATAHVSQRAAVRRRAHVKITRAACTMCRGHGDLLVRTRRVRRRVDRRWRPPYTRQPVSDDYLERILRAQVYAVATETPLEPAPLLSARVGNRLLIKREDQQPIFSFKVRGAYNKIARLHDEQRRRGLVAASAGNHAQGVALAARELRCPATIVMPVTTPRIKHNAVAALGATVVLHGDSYDEAYARARDLCAQQEATFIHPYDDPDVIAGQGTVGVEILRQHPGAIDAIFVPVGGGGLISGIAAYTKRLRPQTQIIGVQAVDAAAMTAALAAGGPVTLEHVGLFSDGTAVKRVGDETFRLCRTFVDHMISVDTDAICAAIKDVFEDTRSILEPAGALAIAGAKTWAAASGSRGKTIVAVASGANMNFDRLRHVSERAELGEDREAILAVTIPERPGTLKAFCRVLGARDITEFNYRYADPEHAHVFVGVGVDRRTDVDRLLSALRGAGFDARDLSANETAKLHIRHMVGGHAPRAADEVVYRFEFPERPGALMKFLDTMSRS
jgi:threonine dehydratase